MYYSLWFNFINKKFDMIITLNYHINTVFQYYTVHYFFKKICFILNLSCVIIFYVNFLIDFIRKFL